MHVALNAMLHSRARSYRSGGISRVIHHLLAELARDPRGHTYRVFLPAPPDEATLRPPAVRYEPVGAGWERPSRRIPWEQTLLPLRLAARPPDVLHSLAFASPLAWRGPTVVTVYDLSFLRFPGAFNRGNRLYLAAITRLSARRARRVVTISQHSKADITALLGVPGERVDVAYPAADAQYAPRPAQEVAAFRAEHGLPERFIFCVGTLEPRKNLLGLLETYARIPAPERLPLYVGGGTGWQFSPIYERLRALGLDRNVHLLGFVPEHALPLWYNAAHLFAFPSLYEGFGLPVLEAMACGTPVITSSVSSIPEVAGPAAILVPPRDSVALADALRRVAGDDVLRARLRTAGLEQARRFSWAGMADETVRSYAKALGSPKARGAG